MAQQVQEFRKEKGCIMIGLLFLVLVLGIFAYGISALPMPPPFKVVAYCILALIMVFAIANGLGYPIAIYNHR